MSRNQLTFSIVTTLAVATLLGTLTATAQDTARKIVKGQKIKVTQEVTFLGNVSGEREKEKEVKREMFFSTATIYLINCRNDRIVRGYMVNQGITHTLQAAIGQTCPGESDAQVASCAAQHRWVPLGGDFPAGTPITVDLVSTRPGDDSTIYIQTIIRNETLAPGSGNAVAFLH